MHSFHPKASSFPTKYFLYETSNVGTRAHQIPHHHAAHFTAARTGPARTLLTHFKRYLKGKHAMQTNHLGIYRIRKEVATPTRSIPYHHSLHPKTDLHVGSVRAAMPLTQFKRRIHATREKNMLCRPTTLVSIVSEMRLARKNVHGEPFESTASSTARIERSQKKRARLPTKVWQKATVAHQILCHRVHKRS
jgi:hypothetical protein